MTTSTRPSINIRDVTDAKASLIVETDLPDVCLGRLPDALRLQHSYPIRLQGLAVGICIRGWIRITIGLEEHVLNPGDLICLLPSHLLQVHDHSDDFDSEMFVLSRGFLNEADIDFTHRPASYVQIENRPTIRLLEQERQIFHRCYQSVVLCRCFETQEDYHHLVRLHVRTMLRVLLAVHVRLELEGPHSQLGRSQLAVQRFLANLTRYHRSERSMTFYAGLQSMTPKYLASLVRKETAIPATEWVVRAVILEAKMLLKTTRSTVQQVATELHFPDQTSFGKYFKKATGLTPSEYRRRP